MKVLMVYYSRTGITRKTTETIAEALRQAGVDVEVEEIVEGRDRSGFMGWLRSGGDAMRKRKAPIEPVKADVAGFDLVAVGTPVWAWTAAPPACTFCREHGKDAKRVAFYCTMGSSGDKGTFKALTDLCEMEPVATLALIDRHVKKDDEEKFLAKAKAFAEAITSTGD